MKTDDIARASGMRIGDLRIIRSMDDQHLLVLHGHRVVAIVGAMGADVEVLEVAELGWVPVMELIGML